MRIVDFARCLVHTRALLDQKSLCVVEINYPSLITLLIVLFLLPCKSKSLPRMNVSILIGWYPVCLCSSCPVLRNIIQTGI